MLPGGASRPAERFALFGYPPCCFKLEPRQESFAPVLKRQIGGRVVHDDMGARSGMADCARGATRAVDMVGFARPASVPHGPIKMSNYVRANVRRNEEADAVEVPEADPAAGRGRYRRRLAPTGSDPPVKQFEQVGPSNIGM